MAMAKQLACESTGSSEEWLSRAEAEVKEYE